MLSKLTKAKDSLVDGANELKAAASELTDDAISTVTETKNSVNSKVAETVNDVSKSYDDTELKIKSALGKTLDVGILSILLAGSTYVGIAFAGAMGVGFSVPLIIFLSLFDGIDMFSFVNRESNNKKVKESNRNKVSRTLKSLERFGVICESLNFENEQVALQACKETGDINAKYFTDGEWIDLSDKTHYEIVKIYNDPILTDDSKQALKVFAAFNGFKMAE